jgi:cellulose synthase/poly-beta-1,6-N-acetylglucosamine synthase-like glycosyltransferase
MLGLLAFSLGLCTYTWLLYPVLVAFLARIWPLSVGRTPSWRPSVTACVAVHDGATHVEAKIESLLKQDYPPDRVDILVYADGCRDDTVALVTALARREPRVRLLVGEPRSGKPQAINRMRREASGEVLLMTDVRQPLAPDCLRLLLEVLGNPAVGCVSGNLTLVGNTGAGLYWRYENWLRRSESRFRSMVGVTGPIYVIRRCDLEEVPPDTVLDDMWIPMRLRLERRLLLLRPEAEAYDAAFDDAREFSRKARTLAGNFQLLSRMPRLLWPPANPSWFETVSHKVLRLVSPWALLLLAASTAVVVARTADQSGPVVWLVRVLAATQVAAGLSALLGSHLGRAGVAARSIIVLNAAAVVGLWRFLTGTQRVTWRVGR